MIVPRTEVLIRKAGEEIARYTVQPGDYVIGRDETAEIRVEGVEMVSRQHAKLIVNYNEIFVEDLGSSNGTFINGKPVTESTKVWQGQKIQIGSATIELRRLKEAEDPLASLAPSTAAVRKLLPEEIRGDRKYDIGGVVAQGGMGAILDAHERATRRTVAMKVMLNEGDEGDLRRFVEEGQVTAQLEHPNIVPVHELSVDENDKPFYTMKFVRGVSLKKVLDSLAKADTEAEEKHPLPQLLTIFQKVCDAVGFAHSKGVIHRDLKPENVMIGDYGEVLLMDWGLAKVVGVGGHRAGTSGADGADALMRSMVHTMDDPAAASATMAGTVMGTPQYMSPEQARGEVENLDARTDIYALGAILYHILALRPPIQGDDAWEIVKRVAEGRNDALTPAWKKRAIPDSLAAVVRKAMALDPAQRYASVVDLQADVTAYQNGFATIAEKAGWFKRASLAVKRNKTASAAATVILALVAGFTAKVVAEGRRAERALADLRKAEPTLLAQADASISLQKFDEALDRFDLATTISPRDPDLLRRRANLLQAMLRLDEAAAAYQRLLVVQPGPATSRNLDLCRRLLAESRDPEKLSGPSLAALYDAMMSEKRIAEAVPLGVRIGKTTAQADALVNERLKPWTALAGWSDAKRVTRMADGALNVTLSGLPISDLSPLMDLPIHHLYLNGTKVADLSPLRGMPLRRLGVARTAVVDVEPLRGMPITFLEIGETKVEKFDLLATLPLTALTLYRLPIRDLSILRGKKLVSLNIRNTEVTSLEPLREMPLRELDAESCPITDLTPLAGMPLDHVSLTNIKGIRSIEPLRNAPLQYAGLGSTSVTDFSPLIGKQLTFFSASFTSISEIRFLLGMPLETVTLDNCRTLPDVSVLAEIPTLKKVVVPRGVRGIELLRKLPELELIGYRTGLERPPAQFWAEYDAQQAAGQK